MAFLNQHKINYYNQSRSFIGYRLFFKSSFIVIVSISHSL